MKKILSVLFMFLAFVANAQEVEMADSLRQDGKIYVVVLVILILLTGLLAFLISTERRVKKLEEEVKSALDANKK